MKIFSSIEENSEVTGKYYFGPDSRLAKILVPDSAKCDDGTIICRKCKKFTIEFGADVNLHAKAKRVEKMRRHESKCQSTPT